MEEALHSTILLPLWIAKILKVAEVSTFKETFLVIHEKAHNQDHLVDAEQEGNNATPSTVQ
eukprot:8272126-Ditylum_brightwellii.AAC.1